MKSVHTVLVDGSMRTHAAL